MVRILLIAFLIFVIVRFVRNLLAASSPHHSHQTAGDSFRKVSDMVQDPHCGIYVAKKEALATRTRDGVLYFCSEECCRKYLQKQ